MIISSEALNTYETTRESRIGTKFGKLIITKYVDRKIGYEAMCDCGNVITAKYYRMASGVTRSCRNCFVSKARGRPTLSDSLGEKRAMINQYKQSAKKRDIVYALSEADAIALMQGNCHYCGKEPSNTVKRTCALSTALFNGIDRFDNSVGYTASNCVSCCTDCNTAKLDKTPEQWYAWLKRITEYQGTFND